VSHPAEFGYADLVVLAVKAHQVGPALDSLEAALIRDAVLLTLQNGLPWWYFQGGAAPHAARVIRAVDPRGEIARRIDPRRVVGGIAYPAAEVPVPGVIRHVEGDRIPIGELDGTQSDRCRAISELIERAGFRAPVLEDVRSEIWLKAWGNLAFNPISAITGKTMAEICRAPSTRELARRMMTDAAEIAARLQVTLRVSLEKRLAGAERVGHHKTSMLQDLEAGQPLEIDAILGSVLELGELVGAPTGTLRAVYDLACAIDPGRSSPAVPSVVAAA
jgi:2-dehydropantoate 2-reductase